MKHLLIFIAFFCSPTLMYSQEFFVSAGANTSAVSTAHSIAIGRSATVTGNRTAQIGNNTGTNYLQTMNVGKVDASTVNAQNFTQGSDRRFKEFISPLGNSYGLSFINKLMPVTYNFISTGKNAIGLIAQDVEKVDESSFFTGSVITADDEERMTLNYAQMVVPLIKAVQELSSEIEKLKAEIKELKNKE